jgi:hypothetical protein
LSFDVFLQFSQRHAPLDDVTARDRMQAVIKAHGGVERAEHGYFFETPYGVSIEMYAGEDRCGAMIALRRSAAETMPFVFDVMKATGWTAFAGDAVAASEAIPPEALHEGCPEPKVVSSVDELTAVLLPDFQKWSNYRDQVVQGS